MEAKLGSTSEITFPYDAVQLNLKRSYAADGSRESTAIFNLFTYNVRSLRTKDDLDRVIRLNGMPLAYVKLAERGGGGLSGIRGGYWMCGIGKTEDNPDAKGLSFLAHSKMKDCVTDFKTYSDRVTEMKKKNLRGKESFTIRNAYAPTSTAV